MMEETTASEWSIAKCYRVLRPFQSALGRLAKLYPALREYPYNEGGFIENSAERARLRQQSRRQIVTYSRKSNNNNISNRSSINSCNSYNNGIDSSHVAREKLLIRNLIQGDDDNGEALRQKTLAVLRQRCSTECYDCIVGIERAFRQLALVIGNDNKSNNEYDNNNLLRVGSSAPATLQQRCALGVGRAIALSAPEGEGEWYAYSEAPYLRRWRKTMIAGHTAQLLVNAFCSVPYDDTDDNDDAYSFNQNDEGNLVLGLLGREAALLVFPLFAVVVQHSLAAQTLAEEYIRAVRAAPQRMTNLWALPSMLRQGLIGFIEVLDLAYVVIKAGGALPCDVHLFLQALPINNGDANAKAAAAASLVEFLENSITDLNIAASESIYPLIAYALTHADTLLEASDVEMAQCLFVASDEDDIALTAQLLREKPERLRPLPSAEVFDKVLGYVFSQQRKDSHAGAAGAAAEFEQALRQRLTRVAGLSSEHREFVCTALAKTICDNNDSPYDIAENDWIHKLLEKHAMDDFYAGAPTALTYSEAEKKRKKNGAIGYGSRGKQGHYTRSKPPPDPRRDKNLHESLQSEHRLSRALKTTPPTTLIISSSAESEFESETGSDETGPETGGASGSSGHDTEINIDASDSDSDGLIPTRPTRATKPLHRRRAALTMPASVYYESEMSCSPEFHAAEAAMVVTPLSASETGPDDNNNNNNNSDDDLLLLADYRCDSQALSPPPPSHPLLLLAPGGMRKPFSAHRRIQPREMRRRAPPPPKRARLMNSNFQPCISSSSSSSSENSDDDDDGDLLMI